MSGSTPITPVSEEQEQSRQLDKLSGKLGKVMHAADQLVVFGRVVDLDNEALETDPPSPLPADKSTPYPVVLVQIGGETPKDSVRLWLPWLVPKAGLDHQWWRPQPLEQVVVIAPSGNWAKGVIIGSLYRRACLGFDDKDEAVKEVDEAFLAEHAQSDITEYRDGSQVRFDPIKHHYVVQLKDNMTTETAPLLCEMKLDDDNKPHYGVSLFEGADCISSLTLDGSAENAGKISLYSGKKDADYKLVLDSKNQQVDITSGTGFQLLLDSKSGEITLKLNENHIKINKAGSIIVKSDKKLTIESPKVNIIGDVKVTGKLDVKQ